MDRDARIRCDKCGERIVRDSEIYRGITGYERVRGRGRGGANGIVLRRETGVVWCGSCIHWAKLGAEQTSLFDETPS